MRLAEQIDQLGQRSRKELYRLRSYYEHTKSLWRLAEEVGGRGRAFDIHDPATGRELEAAEVEDLAQVYISGYLSASVFEKTVSLFEEFVFGLLEAWLTAHPLGIPNKDRHVTYRAVFDASDKQDIVQQIIERELDDLKYEHISRWFAYLKSRVDLGLPTDAQIATLAEIKAARDIIVHNAGIINETYTRKAGSAARYKVGDQVEIREPYLYECWTLIDDLLGGMTAAAVGKA